MGEVSFYFTRASFMDRQLRMEDLPQQAHVVVRCDNVLKLPVVRQTTRSLRSYENVLCVKLSALQLFHVGHFYKIGSVSVLSLYWHDWFSCGEEENERSSSIKYENFTSLFGRPGQKLSPESVPHVQHDYFSSLNQSYYWFVTLSSLSVAVVVS